MIQIAAPIALTGLWRSRAPLGTLLGLSWGFPGPLLGFSWACHGVISGITWGAPGALMGFPGISWGCITIYYNMNEDNIS